MPERKSPQARKSTSGRSGSPKNAAATDPAARNVATGKRPLGGKSAPVKSAGPKASSARPAAGKSASSAGRPPNRKPGKSIVNQKQTPWGLIATTAAIVLFAVAIVVVVVATTKSGKTTKSAVKTKSTNGGQAVNAQDPYRHAAFPAAMKINGVTYRVEGEHSHIQANLAYDATPPIGGNHSQYWADCTGTVYNNPIANENAVHMLEHGAIWITYNAKKVSGSGLDQLKKPVSGIDRMALSPYPGLKTPISLQAWGYQLFLSSPTDPRIAQFIAALKYNKNTTPEYGASSCAQPTFKTAPSTFGHPLWVPKGQ